MKLAEISFREFLSRLAIKRLALAGPLALLCLTAGCGGGGGTQTAFVAVTVSPTPTTVPLGGMQAFMANVTGTSNTAVTWSVQEGAAGGSIISAGLYTAPQVAGTYHVIATSVADSTKSATATIQVPVAVTVNPPVPTVFLGAMQTFVANVAGTTNVAVTWTIQEAPAGGSITSSGVYTAPQVPGTYHVIATSAADTTQSATATISVPPITVTVSPPAPTVFLGAMQTFVATVTATNTAVTWTVQEGAAGGSITSAGVYTAPQVVGTYHVIATSVADTTKSGGATVTVPPVAVSIFPTSDTLGPSGMRTFVARVTGTINPAVTWSITEGAAGGTVDANGHYTAPTAQGTFHVVATSVADPTKSAPATVTVVPSGFLPTGSMTTPRYDHTATLLNTAKALVAGGIASYRPVTRGGRVACIAVATNHADLFDPAAGTFAATGAMTDARFAHTATLLQDGKVLVAGGTTASPGTAEIFDPATATFTATGNMLAARELHTATLLPSGKVLVTGGESSGMSAELFDPGTGGFTSTGSMTGSRFGHTATLLLTGKVLVVGGIGSSGPVSTAELYDPAAGTFSPTGSMQTARWNHTATLLPNGTVLIAGGLDQNHAELTSAEIYDPVTGTFTPTGSMQTAHSQHTATLLPSGKVLVAGGGNFGVGNFVAELFDPGTGTFSLTGSMLIPRISHTATLLPNGEVVVAGSQTPVFINHSLCNGGATASAELYH